MDPWKKQLLERNALRRKNFIVDQPDKASSVIILSSDDEGVVLNGGRRGSVYGPTCILNSWREFPVGVNPEYSIYTFESCSWDDAHTRTFDFNQKQQRELELMVQNLAKCSHAKNYIHLGGGHDHLYPMLKSLISVFSFPSIHLINIDAHTDTRLDQHPHSGTPVRQSLHLNQNASLNTSLFVTQIGLNPHANHPDNFKEITQQCYFNRQPTPTISSIMAEYPSAFTFLSIDLDVLSGTECSAVSAVNPYGLSWNQLLEMVVDYVNMPSIYPKIIGFYEYNPLYDNVSRSHAIKIAGIIDLALATAHK